MRLKDLLMIAAGAGFAAALVAPALIPRSAESSDITTMPAVTNEQSKDVLFLQKLPSDLVLPSDRAGILLLREYGAMFVAQNGVVHPSQVVFANETEVQEFQRSVESEAERIGGYNIVLQKPAMRALEDAVKQAKRAGLSITPRGADSGRRGYDQTVALWRSRVNPGLIFWTGKGRITPAEADRIRRLPTREQVSVILELERSGIFFAKSLDKSIIYSVAPPGSSQHIAMLALDVREFDDPRVRSILAANGWFQTVVSDLPHFTYLGADESELTQLGLKQARSSNRVFWVPDLPAGALTMPTPSPTPRSVSTPTPGTRRP